VKRYEGLFILDTAGKEEGVKDIIDKVTKEITTAGGAVESVQKLDKRTFARVADKKHTSGFYVNVIFSGGSALPAQLHHRFALDPDVFRVLIHHAPVPVPAAAAAPAA
jgi:ribosomal protein S6